MLRLLWAWRESGKDASGTLYLQYSEARREYHKAVRFVNKNNSNLRMEATARALASANSQKQFWKKLKRSFPSKSKAPAMIDGVCFSDPELSNRFSDQYKAVFQKYEPKLDKTRLHALLNRHRSSSKSDCWTQNNVSKAIQMLASDKCTSDGVPPEVFSNASPSLSFHVSLLFRACEMHGYLPPELAEGTIHPVPKANKDPAKLSSYRPITIGCVAAKIFEACILIEFQEQLQSSTAQFGFKRDTSTTHCTLTVKGVAKHYIARGSRVFAAFLVASQAFDRANFYRILLRLLTKGIPESVVRLLLCWYEQTNIRVMFNHSVSRKSFGINHSVRQGGILSPVLFTSALRTTSSPSSKYQG
jgi:hypothetical protein